MQTAKSIAPSVLQTKWKIISWEEYKQLITTDGAIYISQEEKYEHEKKAWEEIGSVRDPWPVYTDPMDDHRSENSSVCDSPNPAPPCCDEPPNPKSVPEDELPNHWMVDDILSWERYERENGGEERPLEGLGSPRKRQKTSEYIVTEETMGN